ncbi:MAG: hypothetical protein DRP78_02665 [Candidatus Omnitrophota bacterium]|nr:MAG: hypothetical protein DRP78_02665 [Candidatus Omnitrophota bacterium]
MNIAARARSLTASPTLAVTSRAKQLKLSGNDVVSFGAGESYFATPEHIKAAAIKAIKEGFTKYTPSSGLLQLKQAICKKLKQDNHLDYNLEQIIVCSGAKHALYNIFQIICDPLDEIIIPAPYWVSYPQMVKVAMGTPVILKTEEKNGFKITPQDLEQTITKKTKALILNSPSNPTGAVYTLGEVKAIAEIALKNNLIIISDEIYEKLIYCKEKHISIPSVNERLYSSTFIVNGVSKAYAMTGWRIGYLAGPVEAVAKISSLQDHSTSCANAIAQMAALEALTTKDKFIDTMRREFMKRCDYMVKRIQNIPKLSLRKPDGAFYAFCNISGTGLDSVSFAQRLLEEAYVAVVPGIAFGNDQYVRLSFAVSIEEIKKGLDRIENWVNKL